MKELVLSVLSFMHIKYWLRVDKHRKTIDINRLTLSLVGT